MVHNTRPLVSACLCCNCFPLLMCFWSTRLILHTQSLSGSRSVKSVERRAQRRHRVASRVSVTPEIFAHWWLNVKAAARCLLHSLCRCRMTFGDLVVFFLTRSLLCRTYRVHANVCMSFWECACFVSDFILTAFFFLYDFLGRAMKYFNPSHGNNSCWCENVV